MTLTVGSLFSGIGGLELGLERAGMEVRWQSEINPFSCRVLEKHWPDVPNLGDITKIDWKDVECVDLICVDRLRTLGNAVVPAVAEYIGRAVVCADAASAVVTP